MFAKRAASVLLALSTMLHPALAGAVNRFAMTSIQNQTAAAVAFNYRWGMRGRWQSSILAPDQVLLFAYPFRRPDENRSLPLFVRFNSSVQGNYAITHRLVGVPAPVNNDPALSQWYVFRYDTNTTFVGLFTVPSLTGGIFSSGVVTITP